MGGKMLAARVGEPCKVKVVSSPYLRCVQSAEIVRQEILERCKEFEERCERCRELGKESGIVLETGIWEIQKKENQVPMAKLKQDLVDNNLGWVVDYNAHTGWHTLHPDPTILETRPSAFTRLSTYLTTLLASPPAPVTILVTHAYIITSAIYIIGGMLYNREINEGGITEIDNIYPGEGREGKARLGLINHDVMDLRQKL